MRAASTRQQLRGKTTLSACRALQARYKLWRPAPEALFGGFRGRRKPPERERKKLLEARCNRLKRLCPLAVVPQVPPDQCPACPVVFTSTKAPSTGAKTSPAG
eukprot:6978439-Alexandrium_andersonii.AAC.1